MKDIKKLEDKLGLKFKNQDLLIQAVVHRSYLNEHPDFKIGHNERLEFLGDAVLELVVTEYLYRKYENPEGELTNWRASLVNAKMLAEVAQEMDIESYLYLSRGEAKDTGKARHYILANAFESLVGAIYIDQGMPAARRFIKEVLLGRLDEIIEKKLYLDPKSKFQEMSQDKFGITPTYKVLEESGPDRAKHFKVGIYLNEEFVASGDGGSKQEAQVAAADQALKVKKW